MNEVGGSSGIRNATILMVFGGAFHLYFGYTWFQLSLWIVQWSLETSIGTINIVLGLLTLCVSLVVWLQKSWASKLIAVIGITACAASVLFGFYLMIIIIAPIYWFAITQFRQGIVYSDWHEDYT